MRPELDENDLLQIFIAEAPRVLPDVRVFRRNVTNLPTTIEGRTFRMRHAIKGQSDAYAIVKGGRHVELETKAARGVMRERQEAWRAFCLAWAVPHLVLRARANEAPADTVARWVEELRAVVERAA